jgi:hypothetical protein
MPDTLEPNPRVVIGGNNPPERITLVVGEELDHELIRRSMDLTERVDKIDEAMKDEARVPRTVRTEEEAARLATFIEQIEAPYKLADERRVEIKRPYYDSSTKIDGYFKRLRERIEPHLTTCRAALAAYLSAKRQREAEEARVHQQQLNAQRGEVAPAPPAEEPTRIRSVTGKAKSLGKRWTFRITNAKQIPLATLRPYIGQDCLEKAIRQYVAKGGRDLKGVEIFEEDVLR